MIYGIGTDIVTISRIDKPLQRFGERFTARFLSAVERQSPPAQALQAAWVAKRFAAKEAFLKALGMGLAGPVRLVDLTICHDTAGRPYFEYTPSVAALLAERSIKTIHLSISDEQTLACAFVVMEC
ncbi:holo-[acyl-carrier protein] synthase [Chitinivorax tropicus]|uniref:Holo-[acyl-carrier-protein] synthase n=1 Tax=Chitinivorax tropicus TaxID=714531 RepID=A0A840MUX6_9PROT|nr:holo-ACP synthase [Chitinivorax tropicus]MBB5020156.1 holo-[acyl-carrier protein] synthase [Chitinivorax tropicus]